MSVSADAVVDRRVVLDAIVLGSLDVAVTRGDLRRWAERFDPAFTGRMAARARLGARDLAGDESLEKLVEDTAADFRYAHSLEAAESLVAWLGARGLTVDAWWESVKRTVLEARHRDEPSLTHGADHDADEPEPVDADDEAALADLVVSDVLDEATQSLARRIAVARSLGAWPGMSAVDARHDALEAIWRPWRAALMDEAAMQQVVQHERLSWIVVDATESRWPGVDAANEAVTCVRADGTPLADVADEAGVPMRRTRRLLADAPDVLRDAYLTAAPGELVGPLALDGAWLVAHVHAKGAPSLDDALVRAAAERALEARATAALVMQHVTRSDR